MQNHRYSKQYSTDSVQIQYAKEPSERDKDRSRETIDIDKETKRQRVKQKRQTK